MRAFEMDVEPGKWPLWCLVLGVLDGKSLAKCCCVSRKWLQIASHNLFWKTLCVAKWPSLALAEGSNIVQRSGGFQKFYALRMKAFVPSLTFEQTKLKMSDLVFFLEVTLSNHSTPIYSFVKEGQDLQQVVSTCPHADSDLFRFVIDVADGLPKPSSRDGGPRGWTKDEMKKFQVSWAVMEKTSLKLLQLQPARKGLTMGMSCVYSTVLPDHSCGPSVGLSHSAEVDILLAASGSDSTFLLQQLRFGFLISNLWRFFTKVQGLCYLDHIFHHQL